jgi:hypothetical protein
MNPFFSIASVRRLQPMIDERVQTFLRRLNELRGSGNVFRLPVVVNAFSNGQCSRAPDNFLQSPYLTIANIFADVIMTYTFGRSHNLLEVPDFDPLNHELMHEGSKTLTVMKHLIWIFRIVQSMPEFMLSHMGYQLATLVEQRNV